MPLVQDRPNHHRFRVPRPQFTSPAGVTGYLAKVDADKAEKTRQKQLAQQRELADKVHRMKAELCQSRTIKRSVVDACVKAVLEPEIEVRITFDNAKEAGVAVERIPGVLLKLGLLDRTKTLKEHAGWPTLELHNGSAIQFKLEAKGSSQTT